LTSTFANWRPRKSIFRFTFHNRRSFITGLMPTTRFLARITIACVFLFAAFSNIRSGNAAGIPDTLYEQLSQTHPAHYASIACEAAIGLWLLSPRWTRGAAIVVILLLSVFSGLIVADLQRDRPMPCGCMGAEFVATHDPSAIRKSLIWSLIRNSLLIGGAQLLLFTGDQRSNTRKYSSASDAVLGESAARISKTFRGITGMRRSES
jgi:uncharacterized membrane protein YphA (DoxX/SURF4 family)